MRVISLTNGQTATRRAYVLMSQGADTLAAVVAAANLVENDPEDYSVGFGGLPNEEGVVELDAAVMHGPTHRCGAVAALRSIRNAASVAKVVLERSGHVLLAGDGALQFARAHGFAEEDLLIERSKKLWLYWKEHLSKDGNWIVPPDTLLNSREDKFFGRPTGTVFFAAMDAAGDISCATSTSGLAFKIPGRVGDSPIIGAGLYVDNEVGSCGSTGWGEANLRNLSSFAAVELMRGGVSPVDAGLEILRRATKHTPEKQFLREDGKPNYDLKFYLLSKDGRYAGVTLWGPAQFAVTDGKGTRLEDCAALYTR